MELESVKGSVGDPIFRDIFLNSFPPPASQPGDLFADVCSHDER